MKVVLAVDLGTTSNRVVAYSKEGKIVAQSSYEFDQKFPKPGWVEHDPKEIIFTMFQACKDVVDQVGVDNIVSMGITNQRETTVLWNRETGEPVYNAIVWQCRRTSDICESLSAASTMIKDKTGLFLDPYFSGTKIKWIIDNVAEAKSLLADGKLVFGTIDTLALWHLTKGRVHATEVSNASRTLCFNIHTQKYDEELLNLFGLPESIFPEVKESATLFGYVDKEYFGKEIPITAILGDQQASLFAHGGREEGKLKNTYGTGMFVMMNTGNKLCDSERLINTIAWKIDGVTSYALEGSIFVGGSAIQWLRDGLGFVTHASETEKIASELDDNEDVYFVPALVGLGAPYWDPNARGMLIGITRGTTPKHITRAVLESIAYQTKDVIEEMKKLANFEIDSLYVDGGATLNNFIMQFQADILGMPVERVKIHETTSFGVAGLAGIHSGFWSHDQFAEAREVDKKFSAKMSDELRMKYYKKWKEAVKRSRGWTIS